MKTLLRIAICLHVFIGLAAAAQVASAREDGLQISGTHEVGETLSVNLAGLETFSTISKINWLRDLVPISGALGSTYTLTESDFGRSISVRIDGIVNGITSSIYSLPSQRTMAGSLVPTYGINFVGQASIGFEHMCASIPDGTIRCVGRNNYGQLGTGDQQNSSYPVQVISIANAYKVVASGSKTCAVTTLGEVFCWGNTNTSRIGDSRIPEPFTRVPTKISSLMPAVDVAIGATHTCALAIDGSVWCWGDNYVGALGRGDRVDSVIPVKSRISAPATSLVARSDGSCASLVTGHVECWGLIYVDDEESGYSAIQTSPSPISGLNDVIQLSSGASMCALLQTGKVECWGSNYYGTLGSGTLVGSEVPVVVQEVGSSIGVSVGGKSVCTIDRLDSVYCWGTKDSEGPGELPINSTLVPTALALGTDIEQIVSGGNRCIIRANRSLACWGSNSYGQLGTGNFTDSQVPVESDGFGQSQKLQPEFSISGSSIMGQVLLASSGEWDPGTDQSYQWFAAGEKITGATTSQLDFSGEFSGKLISAQITSFKPGYAPVIKTAIAPLTLSPNPQINGVPEVGQTLSAITGAWDSGTWFQYQWYADSESIEGANANTYTVENQVAGKRITLQVTGYRPTSFFGTPRLSAATPVITGGQFTQNYVATIEGDFTVGSLLSAEAQSWGEGVTLSYQWLRNGRAITNANSKQYLLSPEDLDTTISLTITASKEGFDSFTSTTEPNKSVTKKFLRFARPTILGSLKVGATLLVKTGSWERGVNFKYQWFADGNPIVGAVKSYLKLDNSLAGKNIQIQITGSKNHFQELSQSSDVTPIVMGGKFATIKKPSLFGTGLVGSSFLVVSNDNWPQGATLSYEWFAGNSRVAGATGPTFSPVEGQIGKQVFVRITVSKAGYNSVMVVSLKTTAIKGLLSANQKIYITGEAKSNSWLMAVVGYWPSGVDHKYQWFIDGIAVKNANSSNFLIPIGSEKRLITVKLSTSKKYFQTLDQISDPLVVKP